MTLHPPPDDTPLADESDAALLSAFVRSRDDGAFTILVQRHSGWVQGVAQRALQDAEMARDAAQQVFILLVRKAARINPEVLGPWLHRTTVLECRNLQRRERARQRSLPALAQHMESMNSLPVNEAPWREALPVLDEAVNDLPERDRALIVQRFFERRSWREIGASLGGSEDAARMALSPVLDKLSLILGRRGAAVPAAALAGLLSFAAKSEAAAGAALAREALTNTPAATPLRSAGLFWASTAACLIAGVTAGWHFTSPPANASGSAITPGIAVQTKEIPDAGGAANPSPSGFDLEAVLADLRRLEAVGNDPALLVRLRGAFEEMPQEAAQAVVAALRIHRWGDESKMIAEAFFRRWGALDPDGAWSQVFAPDLLGAATKTVNAVFEVLSTDNPARFVSMLNDLPQSAPSTRNGGIYVMGAQTPIDLARAHLGSLPGAVAAPHIAAIRSPKMRGYAISMMNKSTAEDCAALAPLAAALPPGELSAMWQLTERWTRLDAKAAAEWINTLSPGSAQRNAAMVGHAVTISEKDPGAAGRMIVEIPWVHHWQMKQVAERWLAADHEAAAHWLETGPFVPKGRAPKIPAAKKEGAP